MKRRRNEAEAFRTALLAMRHEQEWTQAHLAARLGVSERSLSNWECAYALPSFRQRLHLVLALRDAPPEHVLTVADALGVSADPAVAPFLQPYRDALEEPAPVPPPPPPPRAPVDVEKLRGSVDLVVREAADTMNVPANELRAAVARVLGVGADVEATLGEMREAVAVAVRKRGGSGDSSAV